MNVNLLCIFVPSLIVIVTASSNHDHCSSSDGSLVNTDNGCIRGIVTEDIGRSFTKIPYAMPPIPQNDLRFRNPLPATSWSPDILDATSIPPACMQTCGNQWPLCYKAKNASMSEDCLYLNVYTPSYSSSFPSSEYNDTDHDHHKLPVMFYLHGGSYMSGWSGSDVFNGLNFANLNNVIVVVINFRLGSFGFLYDPDHGLDGNYGYFDQLLALKWTYENIEYFGGDQSKIVLLGESSGAMSVGTLLMDKTNTMYSGAIIQSNPLGLPFRTTDSWNHIPSKYISETNCAKSHDVGECLRSTETTESELLDAQNIAGGSILAECTVIGLECDLMGIFLPWTPTFKTEALPQEQPLDAFQNADYNEVPIIFGTDKNEGVMLVYDFIASLFGNYDDGLCRIGYSALLKAIYPGGIGQQIIDEYKDKEPKGIRCDYRPLLSRLITEFWFVCPARNVLVAMSEDSSDLYEYNYNYHYSDTQIMFETTKCLEDDIVCHSSELPMVFQPESLQFTQQDLVLSDYIQEFWSNLAYDGNPNMDGGDEWTAFESQLQASMVFNEDGTFGVQHEYALMNYNCEFWDGLGYLHNKGNAFNFTADDIGSILSCNNQCDRRDA